MVIAKHSYLDLSDFTVPQRKRILKSQLSKMVMSEGQDPDVFINEVNHLKNELVYMGEVINDDIILDIVLGGTNE